MSHGAGVKRPLTALDYAIDREGTCSKRQRRDDSDDDGCPERTNDGAKSTVYDPRVLAAARRIHEARHQIQGQPLNTAERVETSPHPPSALQTPRSTPTAYQPSSSSSFITSPAATTTCHSPIIVPPNAPRALNLAPRDPRRAAFSAAPSHLSSSSTQPPPRRDPLTPPNDDQPVQERSGNVQDTAYLKARLNELLPYESTVHPSPLTFHSDAATLSLALLTRLLDKVQTACQSERRFDQRLDLEKKKVQREEERWKEEVASRDLDLEGLREQVDEYERESTSLRSLLQLRDCDIAALSEKEEAAQREHAEALARLEREVTSERKEFTDCLEIGAADLVAAKKATIDAQDALAHQKEATTTIRNCLEQTEEALRMANDALTLQTNATKNAQSELEHTKDRLTKANNDLSHKTDRARALCRALDATKEELDASKTAQDKQAHALEKLRHGAERTKTKLQTYLQEAAKHKDEAGEARDLLLHTQIQHDELSTAHATLTSQVDALLRQKQADADQLRDAREENAGLVKELEAIKARCASLEALAEEGRAFAVSLAVVQQSNTRLQQRVDDLDARLRDATTSRDVAIQERDAERHSSARRLSNARIEAERQHAEVGRLTTAVEEHKSSNLHLKNSLEKSEIKVDRLQEELAAAQTSVVETSGSIIVLQKKHDTLVNTLKLELHDVRQSDIKHRERYAKELLETKALRARNAELTRDTERAAVELGEAKRMIEEFERASLRQYAVRACQRAGPQAEDRGEDADIARGFDSLVELYQLLSRTTKTCLEDSPAVVDTRSSSKKASSGTA